jgi:hypothetical protein
LHSYLIISFSATVQNYVALVFCLVLLSIHAEHADHAKAEAPGCVKGFKKAFNTPNKVFVSTLVSATGTSKHTQMGYLSYYDESHYPNAVASGQGIVTVDTGKAACSALGPKLCAGFQIFYCPTDATFTSKPNWINLLTPHEVASHANGEVFISDEVTGAAYVRC